MAYEPSSLAAAAAFGQPLFSGVAAWLQGTGPADAEGLCVRPLKSLAAVPRAPISWADAALAVQARDDDKKRRLAAAAAGAMGKPKGLNQPNAEGPPAPQPGSVIGSVADASTFWMFTVSDATA